MASDKMFSDVTKELEDLYYKKNADYGDSFNLLYDEFGIQSVLIRLQDKLNRLKTLAGKEAKAKVENESVKDTLTDLANYAIMALIRM